MRTTVERFIAAHALLQKDKKYIVALSGGADSVALFLLLSDLGYAIEAAHCNFRLRGAESDRDEAFVKTLCETRNIPLHLVHFDTREYAALHKVSIEMAARNLRYSWFEQLRCDIGAAAICVAHHKDDSVETILINLIRGTGIHGLSGIKPVNGHVVRPFLCVSRNQILDYLASVGQTYVDDSTNYVDDVMRNKIRLNVLPALRDVSENVADSILRTANRIGEAAKVFDSAMERAMEEVEDETEWGIAIDITKLSKQPSSEYLLFEILKKYNFTSSQIEQIHASLDSPSGRLFASATHELLFDRGRMLIEAFSQTDKSAQERTLRIPEAGKYILKDDRLIVKKVLVDRNFTLSRSISTATLDASLVRFPLTVRHIKPADRFCPFGMRGSRLVSDYLTDKKKTLFDKRRQLVVVDADDTIVWLVGERPDNRFRIADDTKEVLLLEISE